MRARMGRNPQGFNAQHDSVAGHAPVAGIALHLRCNRKTPWVTMLITLINLQEGCDYETRARSP